MGDLLRTPSPEEAAALREVFAQREYTDHKLIEKLGAVDLPTRRTRNRPRLMRATRGGTPLDTLARLFLFSAPVGEEAAREALDPVPLELPRDLGLVELHGGEVVPQVVLYPYGRLLLAFDPPDLVAQGAPPDMVMGISSSTVDLERFTVRRPVRNALDIGTGCGFQGLLAAEHSERVWAVDYSPRAVNFARFSAALSGLTHVECLEGDRFEPVRGRRFDLIVGNLPFVIAPSKRYLYRDGGMEADAFARSVIRSAPDYLEEGGLCQLICEWAHFAGRPWQERLEEWFAGSGCDVWVIELSSTLPALYAEAWIRDTERDDPEVFARTYEEWTEWYEREGIEKVSTGLIAMRRRSGGRNWFHLDEWPDHPPAGFGKYVLQRFAGYDWLENAETDGALLGARLAVDPGARLVAQNEWTAGGWHVTEARLCMAQAPAYAGAVNAHVVHLLGLLDGERTLRDAVAKLAAGTNVPFERVAAPCVPLVRRLIERGFLVPKG